MKRTFILCGLLWALCTCVSPGVDLCIMIPLYAYPSWYSPTSYVWDDVAAAEYVSTSDSSAASVPVRFYRLRIFQ